MRSAAQARWREQLAGWAIPPEIEQAAPRSPWALSLDGFRDRVAEARRAPSPAHRLAAERLPEGGRVLDVGCGAGAASAPLVPPAGHVTGVDTSPAMLEAFDAAVREGGATATTVLGWWPQVANDVGTHDVAVAFDVAYNVAELGDFAVALDERATGRAVLVLPDRHPMAWTAPYWRRLHGLDRPDGPRADDAAAVLADRGLDVRRVTWQEDRAPGGDPVDRVLQRLCLPDERADEVRALLTELPLPTTRHMTALWWDPAGTA